MDFDLKAITCRAKGNSHRMIRLQAMAISNHSSHARTYTVGKHSFHLNGGALARFWFMPDDCVDVCMICGLPDNGVWDITYTLEGGGFVYWMGSESKSPVPLEAPKGGL